MNPTVVSVGTTHPFACTGMLVEAPAIRMLGARPAAVVAGVSAQDAKHVLAATPVHPGAIRAQFRALIGAEVAAFSIGALLHPDSVRAVVDGLADFPDAVVICDPVIMASGGDRLADDATVAALRAELFPCCTLVTPNAPEASLLTGTLLPDVAALRAVVPLLRALGPRAVLVKGGHLDGEPCDVFGDDERTVDLRAPRLQHDLRGTGSLLAAAIAVRSAYGDPLFDAIVFARAFVRDRIEQGVEFAGMRVAF